MEDHRQPKYDIQDDLEENLNSIRVDTLRILIYLCIPLVVVWFYLLLLRFNSNFQSGAPFGGLDVLPWLVFTAALGGAWYTITKQRNRLARSLFFLAIISAPTLVLTVTSRDQTFMAYALVIPVMLSGLLFSSQMPFWLAGVVTTIMMVLGLNGANNVVEFFEIASGPTILAWLVALTSWLASNDLVSTVGWAIYSNQLAERRSQRLAVSEARVARTLLELEGAYENQSRLNMQLQQLNQAIDIARQSADDANTLKTRFLANMSHELRTPLNAIINFTQFLGKPRYGELTQRQIELQERVLVNSEHLLGLINDILDLSKIEAGRMELQLEPLDLNPIFHGVMATAVGLTKSKGLTLETEIEEDLPIVRADRTRIRQILLNLLSNAAKFTDQGGLTLVARQTDDLVQISVADTGNGIPAEELPLIFEEFHQVEQAASSNQQQGTGLGLPISRHLVALHGGTMWAESELGVGSSFNFTLPVAHTIATEVVIFDPEQVAS